jgi:hypothetical protein
MKALKIDVVNQKITKIEITNYKEIYSAIGNGCNLFCCPIEFENGDVLYSDDEALLHGEVEGCFSMVDWNYPLVGNAIILGSDEEGGMADSKTKANEILEKIMWGNKEVAETYAEYAMQSPTFITYEDSFE